MEIKNVRVFGLNESMIKSGYPMQVGEPGDLYLQDMLENDLLKKSIPRAIKLANTQSGSGHNNFLKGIIVQFDLKYPEYFNPQLQRYHWIDIVSSQSKMHRITSRELTLDDFTDFVDVSSVKAVNAYIRAYNDCEQKDKDHFFNIIISTLPSGYMKWMAISTNYLQLKTIYNQRRHHRLKDWQYFCDWIEDLPMSELIIGKKSKDEEEINS